MYTGWMRPFNFDGVVGCDADSVELSRRRQGDCSPRQRLGLISINSTYIDWIDRRFLYRGMFATAFVLLGFVVFVSAFLFLVGYSLFFYQDFWDSVGAGVCALIVISFAVVFYYKSLKFEFFLHIYYPIRFNRKKREIYVFRDKRDGGVLTVPWDSVFFHIGRGTDMKFLRDIRGEVMEGGVVKDTFALGHCAESDRPVLEMWEFIRRYMEEGPEAVAEVPLDKYVELSVAPTLKNCLISAVGFTNATTPTKRILRSPFIGLFTLVRWLVFKTCKEPQFPPEIEAECRVEPNDPNVWPIPASIGEFAATVPGIMERAIAKAQAGQLAGARGDRRRRVE